MSIVKDLLPFVLFLALVIKHIILYRNFINQRNYFINTLSHDLRISAIAQIRGIDLIQTNQCQKELVNDIKDSCYFSLDMINMLIRSYMYDSKSNFLKYETFNFYETLDSANQTLSELMELKKIKIIYDNNHKLFINADKAEIAKAILILTSTAVYNSEKNSKIQIKVAEVSNKLKVSIIYSGTPLTNEECRRMFLQNPRFSAVGHGIKLHLAKKIIEFHNGRIFVENVNKNKNSFTFIIPLKKREQFLKSPLFSSFQPNSLYNNNKCFLNNLHI